MAGWGTTKYYLVGLLVVGAFILTRTSNWQWWQNYTRPLMEMPLAVGYAWGQEVISNTTDQVELVGITLEQQLATLQRENDELRRELGLKLSEPASEVAVEIIGRRQDELATTYLVNRGAGSGVKPGLAVSSQGVLVGTVLRVTPTSSEIVLVTSPLNTITAEVQNTATSRGVIEGEFNLAVRLFFVPAADELSAGDSVITSGLDELIPRGLIIGKAASVDFKDGDFFKSAVVVSPLDIIKVRFLKIILR